MVSQLKLLPRYLYRFNPWWGFWMFLQIEILRLKICSVKGLPFPIMLRPHSTDLKVFREVFLFKTYDIRWETPKVIIDGGANIGLTSIFLSIKFPDCTIYAVEPDTRNYQTLCHNIKAYPKIIPIHAALWSFDTFIKIKNENDDAWAFTVEECEKTDTGALEGISINTLFKRFSISHVDILKLDIEGSEEELFSDKSDPWIQRTKCILIELHDWLRPNSSKTVFRTIASFNFNVSVFNGMLFMINQDID